MEIVLTVVGLAVLLAAFTLGVANGISIEKTEAIKREDKLRSKIDKLNRNINNHPY